MLGEYCDKWLVCGLHRGDVEALHTLPRVSNRRVGYLPCGRSAAARAAVMNIASAYISRRARQTNGGVGGGPPQHKAGWTSDKAVHSPLWDAL